MYKILAIETSCDETAAAVTQGTEVLSSVKVTQEIHSQWGGVVPSLAKRDHEANIDWVIEKALEEAKVKLQVTSHKIQENSKFQEPDSKLDGIDVIAVTMGPGLAIALGVGIAKAKQLAEKFNKPMVAVNHVEGHILSALIGAEKFQIPNSKLQTSFKIQEPSSKEIKFPAAALVVSGGHTQVILVEEIGKYKVLAESIDDNIGEALDKGGRLLGLPYPGGASLEKLAASGDAKKFKLPLPMAGREDDRFSYSGLKSSFSRLITKIQDTRSNSGLTESEKADLAAAYQAMVFKHLVRITEKVLVKIQDSGFMIQDLLVGGGVVANSELRKRLSDMVDRLGMKAHYPDDMVLCTDNAAMIGVTAGFKAERGEFSQPNEIDRMARWKVGERLKP